MRAGSLLLTIVALAAGIASAAVPEKDLEKITAAAPEKPTVKPEKARKMLVYSVCNGFKHGSIPWSAAAMEALGKKTAAWETIVSDDDANFEPEKIKQFDAVCINQATGAIFVPKDSGKLPKEEQAKAKERKEMLKKSLADYLQAGGGLVGVHAATDGEFGEYFGARFSSHPWTQKVAIRLDDPEHPLNAAFAGKDFETNDEIYEFAKVYSRDELRVLLTLDMDKLTKPGNRPDNDYAVSWVKSAGKGRVFYCSLGHRNEIFFDAKIMRHYLDGVQFAMGDLKADTTPSAKIGKAAPKFANPPSKEKPEDKPETKPADKPAPKEAAPEKPHASLSRQGGFALAGMVALAAVEDKPADPKKEPGEPASRFDDGAADALMGEYAGTPASPGGESGDAEAKVFPLGREEYRVVLLTPPVAKGAETARIELAGKAEAGKLTATGKGNWKCEVADGKLAATADNAGKAEMTRGERKSPTLGAKLPAGAVVLLEQTDAAPSLEAWTNKKWLALPGGIMEVGGKSGDNDSVRQFGDVKLHVEFRVPYEPKGRGQGRGNSGVYLQGRYEVQVLDSFGLASRGDDCGAVYGVAAPKANACLPPGAPFTGLQPDGQDFSRVN